MNRIAPRVLPGHLSGYIWQFTRRHQLALAALSVLLFALSAAPLELQRRIVNDAIRGNDFEPILWLGLAYIAVELAQGALKLGLNIYRAWVSERAVRHLRSAALDGGRSAQLSLVLSEVDPVGGFVGSAVSEPLLQGGILASIFGYMLYLQPALALFSLAVFAPQLVFVPLLQAAINRRVEARVRVSRELSHAIVVQGSARSAHDPAQWRRVNEVFHLHMGMFKLKFTMNFLMNLTHHAGVAAALVIGGWFVVRGEAEVGTVVAFVSGLARVNDPWGDVVNWFRDMTVNRLKYRLVAQALAPA